MFGSGHHNFHHEFPQDYRNGILWYDYDPTKWLINVCEFFGLALRLQISDPCDIQKALIVTAEQKLAVARSKFNWGPQSSLLPKMTRSDVDAEVRAGNLLVIIEGLVYDVSSYAAMHPGGAKVLTAYAGKDATLSFNGGLNSHTQAARTKARSLVVASRPRAILPLRSFGCSMMIRVAYNSSLQQAYWPIRSVDKLPFYNCRI